MRSSPHLDQKIKDTNNVIETLPLEVGVPQKISTHLTRLLCPNPSVFTGPGTNTYIVGDEKECIIIDPGPNLTKHTDRIIELYDGKVKQILLTHTHGDHSPGCAPLLAKWSVSVAGKLPDFSDFQDPIVPDVELVDGMTFSVANAEITAIATPGHASNHFCFLVLPDNILLTGDHIMQGSTVVVSPPDGDMAKYMHSLQKVKDYQPSKLAPAHGHVLKDPNLAIQWLVEHRMVREAKILDHLKQHNQPVTPAELVTTVYNDTDKRLHGIAIRSLLAHLLKLVVDNKATQPEDGKFLAVVSN